MGNNLDPALSPRFKVEIDHHDLGTWTKCDGLSVEYEIQEYKEGGENRYVHRLPGRAKYQNVKLTRPINANSDRVAAWLSSMLASVQKKITPGTGHIALVDPEGKAVASWNLADVYPVKWSGPSLDAGSNQFATESLELAHNGFLSG